MWGCGFMQWCNEVIWLTSSPSFQIEVKFQQHTKSIHLLGLCCLVYSEFGKKEMNYYWFYLHWFLNHKERCQKMDNRDLFFSLGIPTRKQRHIFHKYSQCWTSIWEEQTCGWTGFYAGHWAQYNTVDPGGLRVTHSSINPLQQSSNLIFATLTSWHWNGGKMRDKLGSLESRRNLWTPFISLELLLSLQTTIHLPSFYKRAKA